MRARYTVTIAVLTLGLTGVRPLPAVTAAAPQQSAAPEEHAQHAPAGQQAATSDMMKRHQQMMAEMKAGTAKLDALVTTMHAARGDAKIDAVAAAVTELVRQQKTMHDHMERMHEPMMGMGGHRH